MEDDEQVASWWKLVGAVEEARNKLHGEELELFQQLVGKGTKARKQHMIVQWKMLRKEPFNTPSGNNGDEEMTES